MDELPIRLQWTMENVEKFISLYKKHECLWNPEVESYKHLQMKKIALDRIVSEMRMPGLTAAVAKERVKSIRTMYRREVNKVIKSIASTTNPKYVYKPKLFWFDQIDAFLRPIAMSKMDGTITRVRSFSTSQTTEPINDDSDDNSSFQEQRTYDELTEDPTLVQIEDHRSPSKCSPSIEHRTYKKRKCSVNDLYAIPDNRSEENEFDIFGKFISAQLKKLPLITALQCQQKIQDFLTSKRIEILEYQNGRRVEKSDVSRAVSPFSSFIDMDCEEKPNVQQDFLYQEKDPN